MYNKVAIDHRGGIGTEELTDVAHPTPARSDHRKPFLTRQRLTENLTGYLFIFPAVLVIGLFGLFPIGYAIYMSLFNWRVTKGRFTGLANYEKAIGDIWGLLLFLLGIALLVVAYKLWTAGLNSTSKGKIASRIGIAIVLVVFGVVLSTGWGMMLAKGDKAFLNSLIVTFYYAFGTVPLQLALALVLAYVLFQKIRGKEFFRMIYFLPYVTPIVTTAVIFRIMFSPRETSLANQFLNLLTVSPQKWLFEPRPVMNLLTGTNLEGFWAGPSLALVTIILYGVWTFVGYNTVIFLAGLGSISKELYEAAQIDGADDFGLFRHITIPLLSPVTFYLFLVSFIGTFKAFNHLFVMQVPSAQNTVATTSVQIFNVFYKANNYGYAAAESILLFLVIIGLTVAQNKLFATKVFYG